MAGETMQPMPMSPRQSPAEIGSAAVQWACTRRGRTLVLTIVLFVVLLALGGMHNREAISSRYHALSSNHQWRPHLPHIPSIIHSPFKKPSNTTLQLENGELTVIPPQLKKTTPNFHLVMPAVGDSDGFCQTTLSAMLLNYPPPTIVNLYQEYEDDIQWERDTLQGIRQYLNNDKYVQDEDLVLIVDGENSWFQLPSDAIIRQYARLIEQANARLLKRYGTDKDGYQRFNQTIIFGAEKMCEGDDMACKYAPHSILPTDLYGKDEDYDIADRPARYLNSQMHIGPAKDLKALYQTALRKFDLKHNQRQTIQSVFATIFGEQQLRRDAEEKREKPISSKIKDLFVGNKAKSAFERRLEAANLTLSNTTQHEFSIGLDYTHTLFQPFAYCNEDELIPLIHDNSTDLSKYLHPTSWSQYLAIPPTLERSNPPFWRLDLAKNNPSPNEKSAYIDKLDINKELDELPGRKTSWNNVPLLQNTFTGAVPAIVLNDPLAAFRLSDPDHPPTANITYSNMWFSPFKRALLRNYLRHPQSPNGYHNSLVGGDRAWDMRGGRGGIWTAAEQAWLPWGEVDGVCGTLTQIQQVFSDGKGVWLHETENLAEAEKVRLEEEQALAKKVDEERVKEIERQKANNEKEQKLQKELAEKAQKEKEIKKEKELKRLRDKEDEAHKALEAKEKEKERLRLAEKEREKQEMRAKMLLEIGDGEIVP